ncbi:hypothetical protein ACWDTP_38125 [Mycobacterium sp. NPDC003449]
MALIALEEHYAWDPASTGNVVGTWLRSNNPTAYAGLCDRSMMRLEQILSLFDPGVQDETDVARAVDLARRANDDLADTVRGKPDRFGGFATLATRTRGPRPPNWGVRSRRVERSVPRTPSRFSVGACPPT